MKIPTFKNTHDAVRFVRKHFGSKTALKYLKKKRKIFDKEADKIIEGLKKKRTIDDLDKLSEAIATASCYREAIEMMEKKEQWEEIWGELE